MKITINNHNVEIYIFYELDINIRYELDMN